MLGVDSEFGASLLRLWIAAGSAALLVVLSAVAFFQPQRLAVNSALRPAFVIAGAIFGALMTWAFSDGAGAGGAAAERRALELRAQQLNAQVLMPGSPLACLESVAGEKVEAACEKALFASPASVASASAYVAAQLTLLANMRTFAHQDSADLEPVLIPLRRSLETDRFGFVAHVLATRDGCSAQKCKVLALFRDPNRVRANLSAGQLERYLEYYTAAWTASDVPVADAAHAAPAATGSAAGQPKKIVNIDFPSAASIPAVSIMNPEPNGPVLPGVAAASAANPNGPPPRHSRKSSSAPNPNVAATSPSGQPGVEPIWPEPMPASSAPTPPAAAPAPAPVPAPAAAPAPAPATAGPVQLTPPAVNASAAPAPRTQ
jgi:hypothetical protein